MKKITDDQARIKRLEIGNLHLSKNIARLRNFANELVSIANDGDLITPHGIKEITKRHKIAHLLVEESA